MSFRDGTDPITCTRVGTTPAKNGRSDIGESILDLRSCQNGKGIEFFQLEMYRFLVMLSLVEKPLSDGSQDHLIYIDGVAPSLLAVHRK